MYAIHHRKNYDTPKSFVVIAAASFREEAIQQRKMSGDLLIDLSSMKIDTKTDWLFPWEENDPQCYAQRAIAWQKKQDSR